MNSNFENIKKIDVTKPLKLECAETINNFPQANQTYGKLNSNKDCLFSYFYLMGNALS